MRNIKKWFIVFSVVFVCSTLICVLALAKQASSRQENIDFDIQNHNITHEELAEQEIEDDTQIIEEQKEQQNKQEQHSESTPQEKPAKIPTPELTEKTPDNSETPVPNNSINSDDFETEVVALCNFEREKASLPPLENDDPNLQQAANLRATEIKTLFSHTRPDGTSCFEVLKLYNITAISAGENIAYGQKTPSEVVQSWMSSEGHKSNILSNKFNYVAVGKDDTHWVQLFIKR